MSEKYRLVTRSDFDGLVCGTLLKELDLIDDVVFVHPKDMQDGKIPVTNRDITTNLPDVEGVHLAFDHHASETVRVGGHPDNLILHSAAPSAARVVYDHYGGAERFPRIADELMVAVDRADAAQLHREEVLHPEGWVLLNFLMDARTGLGRFRQFSIGNYDLMMLLIDACREHSHDVDKILALPDVAERVALYLEQGPLFVEQLQRVGDTDGSLVVLDLRNEERIHAGNRFMIYALFPEVNISMHVLWGKAKRNVVFAVGKSIFDRSCKVHVGKLMLEHGGGGHAGAGTCQVAHDKADEVQKQLVEALRQY